MKKLIALTIFCLAIMLVAQASAEEFYPISSVASSTANDLWPASNLIQGPGVGFDANEPHDKTCRWVGRQLGNRC